jgi:phosphatidylglycerol:prolipoprotein diacylglycerol transferase
VIDPIAFTIGPLKIHWYGIIIATAVLAGTWLGLREARRRGESTDHGWSILMVCVVTGIIGARAYHVIHEWTAIYRDHPDLIIQVWNGGIGIPGALIGGVVGIWIYTRRNHLSFWRWADIFAPAVLLGQAIGRLGNFVNQELYGPPTDLPWGIPIDEAHRVPPYDDMTTYPASTVFHPLFAYEAILNLIGMFLLLWISRRFASRLYDGDVVLMYFIWYGTVRTLLEGFRTGNWLVGGIPTAALLGVTAAVGSAIFLVVRHWRGWGTPGSWMHQTEGGDAAAEPSPEPSAG